LHAGHSFLTISLDIVLALFAQERHLILLGEFLEVFLLQSQHIISPNDLEGRIDISYFLFQTLYY
jgi:hypothetical protein